VAVAAFSLIYCATEGVVSVFFGNLSGSNILLLFGIDSIIEVTSAALVLWRLLGKGIPLERERKAVLAIGALLVLLGITSYAKSVYALVSGEQPETALPSLIIGAASCVVMITAWRVKLSLSRSLNSVTLASDAACSLACAQMSAIVLISGAVYRLAPSTWWVDAAATLLLAHFFTTEGRGMIAHALSKDFAGGGCCGA